MLDLLKALVAKLKGEPILVLTAIGIIANTAGQALAGGADAATVVQDVLAALLGWVGRGRVTPV